MQDALIVIPCFNEEKRLPSEALRALAQSVPLLFVNDGSTDGTEVMLQSLGSEVMSLSRNSGKAEAVRQGMQRAANSGARWVGFADADLATPPEELVRLIDCARQSDAQVVMGSRVALAGTRIERKPARHYAGRLFATAASMVLRARFYDTQCGAKLFANTPLLQAALATPFHSRWIFDVELLGRLLAGTREHPGLAESEFLEVPLQRWRDVAGSKLRPSSWVRAGLDLGIIAADLARRRR